MKTMEQRIASAELQLRTLRERHAKSEAKRKKDEALQAKKDEERRREIVGTVVLERVRGGEIPDSQFRKWLDPSLTDSKDRALFGL